MTEHRNHFLEREARTANLTKSHHRAPKQERQLAIRVQGRVTPQSGAGAVKGDVRVRGILRIEAKTTIHKSFSVTLDMIRKIEAAASSCGEAPAMVIEFLDSSGKPIKEVALVPTYVLEELVAASTR
jgi:hypothetical protein